MLFRFVYRVGLVLAVPPTSTVKNVTELAEHLKAKQGKVLYGVATTSTLAASELFKQMTGAPAKPLPYKTAPDAMKEVTESAIDFMIMDGTFAAGQVAQGALKALAVTTATRSPSFPGVPTMQEAGLAGFEFAQIGRAHV